MFDSLGAFGWVLIALGWLAAGLVVAWIFGSFVQAGKGERTDRSVPSSVGLYTDPAETDASPPPAAEPIKHSVKL